MESWVYFLIITIICLVMQSYFTMMEMALVSFHRLRLQYYISQGNRKAIWLSKLIQKPTYLFGTTLIGVNFFLQMGSESARMFYLSLGLNPDLALVTQIVLVVIFAELAPMFAARSHAEQTTMLGITPIYFLSKVLVPFIWLLNGACRIIDWILKSPPSEGHYLTREELQKAIEEGGVKRGIEHEDLDTLVQNIFEIKKKSPKEIMTPINEVPKAAYNSLGKDVKGILSRSYAPYLPLYYKDETNVFGIIYTRDLLRLDDEAHVREIARSPWFITEKNSVFQILKQFRSNTQRLAIVLDEEGQATGILTLDTLIEEIFHNTTHIQSQRDFIPQVIVNRSFPAATLVSDLNLEHHLELPHSGDDTLEDLMGHFLGHSPQKADSVVVSKYILTLEVVPLLADKTVRINSLST